MKLTAKEYKGKYYVTLPTWEPNVALDHDTVIVVAISSDTKEVSVEIRMKNPQPAK